MGRTVLLTGFITCSISHFALSKNTKLKMINLLSLQTDTSEERKKSNQMHILKLSYVVLVLTTFYAGTSETYQHLALWSLETCFTFLFESALWNLISCKPLCGFILCTYEVVFLLFSNSVF